MRTTSSGMPTISLPFRLNMTTIVNSSATSVIGAILHATPPPLTTLQPLASESLDHIVSRCLAKNPDQRVQSMKDLAIECQDGLLSIKGEKKHEETRNIPILMLTARAEERDKLLLITNQQRAQLVTTGAGEQSFAAAVQKVDTIRSNLQAIGADGERKQLPTLYVQVANEAQRREWLELRDVAKELGYVVPGIEVVGARAPGRTEVRYFHTTDRPVAEQLIAFARSTVAASSAA